LGVATRKKTKKTPSKTPDIVQELREARCMVEWQAGPLNGCLTEPRRRLKAFVKKSRDLKCREEV
jgi:hypothetical protein